MSELKNLSAILEGGAVPAGYNGKAIGKLSKTVSGWANTSCRFDFSQERSLCLSYVYVQW